MNSKIPLVQYRRTSSDMDLSTSDDDENVIDEGSAVIVDQSKGNKSSSMGVASTNRYEHNNIVNNTENESSSSKYSESSADRVKDRKENGRRDSRSKEHDRDRKERKRNPADSKYRDRSTSPDRRKRRSPERSRRSPHRHRSRSPGRRKHSPDRRDRRRSPSPEYKSRRYGRYSRLEQKVARIDKLGLELFSDAKNADNPMLASFCNPGAMNPAARLTEQIQKRKLLWGAKKETPPVGESLAESAGTSKTWEAATFKGDNDGKMTEKFKRLMGIKGDATPASTVAAPQASNSLIKKQEEMFSNMEAQYQVARMATHTHRGIGLGFGTFQVPPR